MDLNPCCKRLTLLVGFSFALVLPTSGDATQRKDHSSWGHDRAERKADKRPPSKPRSWFERLIFGSEDEATPPSSGTRLSGRGSSLGDHAWATDNTAPEWQRPPPRPATLGDSLASIHGRRYGQGETRNEAPLVKPEPWRSQEKPVRTVALPEDRIVAFVAAKRGRAKEASQDRIAMNLPEGKLALADGASRAAVPGPWAELIARRFTELTPHARDNLVDWLAEPAYTWETEHGRALRESSDFSSRNLATSGAAATLLGIQTLSYSDTKGAKLLVTSLTDSSRRVSDSVALVDLAGCKPHDPVVYAGALGRVELGSARCRRRAGAADRAPSPIRRTTERSKARCEDYCRAGRWHRDRGSGEDPPVACRRSSKNTAAGHRCQPRRAELEGGGFQ